MNAKKNRIHITAIFKEALTQTKGFKAIFWRVNGLILLSQVPLIIISLLTIIPGLAIFYTIMTAVIPSHHVPQPFISWSAPFYNVIYIALLATPLLAGLEKIAWDNIHKRPVKSLDGLKLFNWHYIKRFAPASLLFVSSNTVIFSFMKSAHFSFGLTIAASIAFFLLVNILFYYYKLAIMTSELSGWAGLRISLQVARHHWLKILSILFTLFSLLFLSCIPSAFIFTLAVRLPLPHFIVVLLISISTILLIGFVWIIPFIYNAKTILFREVMAAK